MLMLCFQPDVLHFLLITALTEGNYGAIKQTAIQQQLFLKGRAPQYSWLHPALPAGTHKTLLIDVLKVYPRPYTGRFLLNRSTITINQV